MTHPIVSRDLQVAQRHPDWSSLQILDVAMDWHVETHPDFEVPPNGEGYATEYLSVIGVSYVSPGADRSFDA